MRRRVFHTSGVCASLPHLPLNPVRRLPPSDETPHSLPASTVPNQAPSIAEREHCDTIRTPAIARRLQNGWKACPLEDVSDDIVQFLVTEEATSTVSTGQWVISVLVNIAATSAMPILRTSGSNCVPRLDTETVPSHTPDFLQPAAKSRALTTWSASASILSLTAKAHGIFQI